MVIGVHDAQHLQSFGMRHFLRIARIRYRFVLIVFEANVAQLHVRHIFHVNPSHLELSLPLILRPNRTIGIIINRRHHLGHSTEMTGSIHRKEQIHRSVTLALPKRLVQSFVTVLCAAPNLVLDAAMNIVFRIRFDNKKACIWCRQIKVRWIVVVFDAQFV